MKRTSSLQVALGCVLALLLQPLSAWIVWTCLSGKREVGIPYGPFRISWALFVSDTRGPRFRRAFVWRSASSDDSARCRDPISSREARHGARTLAGWDRFGPA